MAIAGGGSSIPPRIGHELGGRFGAAAAALAAAQLQMKKVHVHSLL